MGHSTKEELQDTLFELEMEIDMLRWKIARGQAEELVLDRGWSKEDEDFWYQVEDEAKRLLEEDLDREMPKRPRWDEDDEREYPEEN